MPNEPCGDRVCIETIEADLLRKRLDDAIAERDRLQVEVDNSDIRCGRLAFEIADLKGHLASLTTERDSAVAAVREQDAALAAYRKCLQGLVDAIRSLEGDVPDSALCLGQYGDHMEVALPLLASDAGKATLEYIRGLEADNVHLRSVIQDATHIRPAVQWFAEEMERQLRANDHKGGWSDCADDYLLAKLDEEVGEVKEAVQSVHDDLAYKVMSFGERGDRGGLAGFIEAVIHEAADLANFAMMIADNARRDTPDLLGGEKRG